MTRFAQASLALLPLAALVVLAASIAQSPLRLCPDCGVNLEAGELFSEGKRPYVDFVPLNPPLVVYLNALPAYVAERFGAHPVVVLNVFFFFLVAWSTLTSRSLGREEKTRTFSPSGSLLAASWAGFSLWLWLGRPFPVNDYGQREHLFVLLWLPYALLRCRDDSSRPRALPRVVLGVLAALGTSLKPYFVAAVIAAEASLLLARRSARGLIAPEALAAVATGLFYGAHFAFLSEPARQAFFGTWLPLLARYYREYALAGAFSVDPWIVSAFVVGALSVVLGHSRARGPNFRRPPDSAGRLPATIRESRAGRALAYFGAFTCVATGMVYWQAKGFFYHRIPALAGLLLLVVFLAETVSRTLPETRGVGRHRFFPALLAVAGWLVLLWFAPRALSGNDPTNPLLPQFRTLLENYTRETEPVAVFSTSVWPAYPTLPQLRRRQGHRFLSAPYLYIAIAARREDGGAAEKLVFGMVREDIERERPPLILVADGPCAPCEGRSFAGHVLGQLRPVMGAYTRIFPPGLPPRFLVFARTAESSGG